MSLLCVIHNTTNLADAVYTYIMTPGCEYKRRNRFTVIVALASK